MAKKRPQYNPWTISIGSPLPVLDETHQMILAYDVALNPHSEGFGSNFKTRSALLNATMYYCLDAKPMETTPEFGVIDRTRKFSVFLHTVENGIRTDREKKRKHLH